MTLLLILFWIVVIVAIIAGVLIHRKTWASDVLYWALIVAIILLGVQTNLIAFLKPVLQQSH